MYDRNIMVWCRERRVLLLALLWSVCATSVAAADVVSCEDQGWHMLWQDDFTTNELNTSVWEYELYDAWQYGFGKWGNREVQFYTRENIKVEDGVLKLIAEYEPDSERLFTLCWDECYHRCIDAGKVEGTDEFGGCMDGCGNTGNRCNNVRSVGISSGRVYAKSEHFQPTLDYPVVRIEAKIRAPAGLGLWPAFWMLPWSEYLGDVAPGEGIYGPWPASGEIDVMEMANQMDFVNGSIHFGGPLDEGLHRMIVSSTPLDPPGTEYHVFGVEWHYGLIRWYVDGIYYGHATSQYGPENISERQWWTSAEWGSKHKPFDQPFYPLFNFAVGGYYPEQSAGRFLSVDELQQTLQTPKVMEVDYIKVCGYQL